MTPRFARCILLSLAVCTATLAGAATAAPDLADRHAQRAKLACADCHPGGAPTDQAPEASAGATDARCVACHGSGKALAAALAPKLANPYVNPHASHLVEIACSTCHRGHSASESFCLQCHAFEMPMAPRPDAGRR